MAVQQHTTEPTRPAGVNTARPGAEQLPKAGTIRFDAHHSGTLNARGNMTSWGCLPAIFTLANTRQPYNNAIHGEPFQTDAAGLKRLVDISEDAEDAIADAVEVIGILLAQADAGNVDAEIISRAGWLLAGLAEMRRVVASTRSDAGYHLSTGRYAVAGGDQ